MVRRILVIDDERDVRECVTSLLATLPDCEVESAATCEEGLRRAAEPWDLVISDFSLPDGTGVEILAACEARRPEQPRLLMTAFQGHPQVLAAMHTPTLTACVRKPFDPEALLDRVARLLGS